MTAELLVCGGGIAGLTAAITGVEAGLAVTLVDDGDLRRSASVQAQGGFSAVTADGILAGDSIGSHVADTLDAGARHGDASVIATICAAAADHVATLTRWGTVWDRDESGRPALTREAAHAASRILHSGGDATGAGIVRALRARVDLLAGDGRMVVRTGVRVASLILNGGSVAGVQLRSGDRIDADAVLLATGGISGVYGVRTSSFPNPGDGAALAWRAGAVIADAEMVQFHPTFAPDAQFMLTEALRGEGAVLRDASGARFMQRIDERAELAPRDVVARGVAGAMGGAWLDASPIVAREGAGFIARRFPTVSAALLSAGVDLEREPVRVLPAQHYWMGGVAVDEAARSSIPGLLVAGEAARTGFHGANRLASNSLLEAVHGGLAAVGTVALDHHHEPGRLSLGTAQAVSISEGHGPSVADVRALADGYLGVHRTGSGMSTVGASLDALTLPGSGPGLSETLIARIIAVSGSARTVSLGAHHRDDSDPAAPPRPGETIAIVTSTPLAAEPQIATPLPRRATAVAA